MDQSLGYRDLWPAHTCALEGLFAGYDKYKHFYAYIPPDLKKNERPRVVVFFHGHGSNTALYLHVWRSYCEANRIALFAPTFSYGNWEHPKAIQMIHFLFESTIDRGPFDTSTIFLAGISQGGCGVARAGAEFADRLAGLVFLSPTLEPAVLGSEHFIDGWKNRPVLVVHGGKDRHVKPATVDAGVELMRQNGIDVEYTLDPDVNHFLFFQKRDEVFANLGRWMASVQ